MYRLELELKQHTPMIHFQHNQKGATLRATEFKPKFDRFLIENAFNNDFDKYKFYLKGFGKNKYLKKDFGQNKALEYKMSIEVKGKLNQKIEPSKSLFFGNMGKNDDKLFCTNVYEGFVKVTFISFNKNLLNKINENIGAFIATNNFGTRQNKGFGSFYLNDKNDEKHIFNDISKTKERFWYIKYNVKKNSKIDISEIFKDISFIYSLMKGGINSRGTYKKSFLFIYMLEKQIGNEKRFIKETFDLGTDLVEKSEYTNKYVRSLLGVADNFIFKDDQRKGTIVIENKKIERFKSPITFKIINNILFIIPEFIDERIYGKTFEFHKEIGKNSKFETEHHKLKVPNRNEFDLIDFLEGFCEYYNALDKKTRKYKEIKSYAQGGVINA